MRISVPANSASSYPVSGDYLFISSAVGNVEVTWQTENGSVTGLMEQGETIQMDYTSLSFSGLGNAQEIDIRAGFGQYTPPITSVTSTIIDQVKKPISISSIEQALSLDTDTNPIKVHSIADPVVVSGVASTVDVEVTAPVVVSGIASTVEVEVTAPVVVSGIASTVDVEVTAPVEVIDQTGAAFKSNDYLVTAGSYVDIPERDRSQIIFQNVGENETRCRVSDVEASEASGMWLIGGGSLFGESPILRTKAALRVWNISDVDALVTVNEVY